MIFYSTNGSIQQGLVVMTSLSVLGIFLSWKRQIQLEEECTRLRRSLAESGRKQRERTLDEEGEVPDVRNAADQINSSRVTLSETMSLMEDGLQVKPIGVIRSIYRLCVGTPRQGLLCPNARGVIDMFRLGNASMAESVQGLEEFSHIWIVFVFHLNTQSKDASRKTKSKITPPALGGEKVGIYATRTPHRYNPIGLTLCKLDRIEMVDKRTVRLHISGLDLVDGTPVLDIKPYVPVYDSVQIDDGNGTSNGIRVPGWVSGGLSMKRLVTVTESATSDLRTILQTNPEVLEFYGPRCGETTIEATLASTIDCILQVLSIDVRSSYQTKKSRDGKFQAERSRRLHSAENTWPPISNSTPSSSIKGGKTCSQQLDNLLIHYHIDEPADIQRTPSCHSGAEDIVQVTAIELRRR
jgi:tRNA-Thr(GGU) m(6)t(6)A37 methyltransferase TsaA